MIPGRDVVVTHPRSKINLIIATAFGLTAAVANSETQAQTTTPTNATQRVQVLRIVEASAAIRPQSKSLAEILQTKKVLQDICMFLDWTNWTFWVTAIALVAFGFCLRDIYEQWRFRKVRRNVSDELREVDNLTRRLQAATERLNKVNEEGSRGAPRS